MILRFLAVLSLTQKYKSAQTYPLPCNAYLIDPFRRPVFSNYSIAETSSFETVFEKISFCTFFWLKDGIQTETNFFFTVNNM